jgi:hypothetical protein
MKTQSIDIDIDFLGSVGTLEIQYTWIPEIEGRSKGAPENCYEGSQEEFEIESVMMNGKDLTDLIQVDSVMYDTLVNMIKENAE